MASYVPHLSSLPSLSPPPTHTPHTTTSHQQTRRKPEHLARRWSCEDWGCGLTASAYFVQNRPCVNSLPSICAVYGGDNVHGGPAAAGLGVTGTPPQRPFLTTYLLRSRSSLSVLLLLCHPSCQGCTPVFTAARLTVAETRKRSVCTAG